MLKKVFPRDSFFCILKQEFPNQIHANIRQLNIRWESINSSINVGFKLLSIFASEWWESDNKFKQNYAYRPKICFVSILFTFLDFRSHIDRCAAGSFEQIFLAFIGLGKTKICKFNSCILAFLSK